jgi:hypothetical protein
MNPLAYLEAAGATLVVLWLAGGLLSDPLLFGVVAALALVPLALVVLPALVVHALADRSVTVRRLPPLRSAGESAPPRPDRGPPSDG